MSLFNDRDEEQRAFAVMPRREVLIKGLIAGAGAVGLGLLGQMPAFASQTGAKVHVVGLGTDQVLYHTIHFANGTWAPSYGIINAQERNGGLRFNDVACGGVSDLQVVASDASGNGILWHTIRSNLNGSWSGGFGNVNAQMGNGSLQLTSPSCAVSDSGRLHLLALNRADNTLYHTIRETNGSWQGFFGQVPGTLNFKKVGCAALGEDLHVVAIDNNGTLWHTIRFNSSFSWQSGFDNVSAQISNSAGFVATSVSCVFTGTTLNVATTNDSGFFTFTSRDSSGTWQPLAGVIEASHLFLNEVSYANLQNGLMLVGVGFDSSLDYSILPPGASWPGSFSLLRVNDQESNGSGHFFSAVACAGTI